MIYGSALNVEDSVREEARLAVGPVFLDGILTLPVACSNVVLLVNGGPLNHASRFVAKELRTHGMGTFSLDLLTAEEGLCYRKRFDINLLTTRLIRGLVWLRAHPDLKDASIGLFGIGAGAAAVLNIAARSTDIGAVVTRCGRPDLVESELRFVRCPTLFIAGGRDYDVLRLNRHFLEALPATKELAVVPDATHTFDEPGALEMSGRLAAKWFLRHLKAELDIDHHRHIAATG